MRKSKYCVKPMSKTQLAKAYGIDVRTFNKWIKNFQKEIGKQAGRLYNPRQINTIFQCIGYPDLRIIQEYIYYDLDKKF